ncbi:MAG: 16S rRNA (cytosine(1402)-N(4))-methyltransferase RsmH [Alphaproteobacteria bacterium]|nr:16S rRNA (cytosine(1402)-N(4))-methyltransferase RsmH [Alphaproteobacteria bacterium]
MPEAQAPTPRDAQRHVPVMLPEVLRALQPETGGIFVDGTFGAGGYTRGILQSANAQVIAIDRDPSAIAAGQALVKEFAPRLRLVHGAFSSLKELLAELGVAKVQGVVLDIGVSSMQLDEAGRGFSFMKDGPLDMRMAQAGKSARDYVNALSAEDLANIVFIFGEEPRSRAIARAIVKARSEAPLMTTLDLVRAVERATGPQRATDRTHPATRTFQALRIFVNAELDELAAALLAAEEVLEEGGRLVIVTFHSLEDRIVKRFFTARAGREPQGSRHQLVAAAPPPATFTQTEKGAVAASEAEARANARARSAKLRFGIRTAAPPTPLAPEAFGLPRLEKH